MSVSGSVEYKPVVQGVGLYWKLGPGFYVSINVDSSGHRVAGVMKRGLFSGWTGVWTLEPEKEAVLIEVSATKYGYEFLFDGRLQVYTANTHLFRNMMPELEDGYASELHFLRQRLVVTDFDTAPAADGTPASSSSCSISSRAGWISICEDSEKKNENN